MDQVTQQNTAMVEQTTAASHSLSQETGELVELIKQFRVGELAQASAKRRAAPKVTASDLPSKARRYCSTPTVSPNRHLSATQRKLEPVSDDWQDF